MYDRLQKVMNEKGISRYALAIQSRINPSALYQAIGGQIPFWPGWRKRVADALGMGEDDLFNEEEMK